MHVAGEYRTAEVATNNTSLVTPRTCCPFPNIQPAAALLLGIYLPEYKTSLCPHRLLPTYHDASLSHPVLLNVSATSQASIKVRNACTLPLRSLTRLSIPKDKTFKKQATRLPPSAR